MHNGVSIENYEKQQYGKNVTTIWDSEKIIDVRGNDEIVSIIPRELFKTPGKTLHIGKAYGFYIECRKLLRDSDVLLSTVIIIDLSYNE